jgi:two-component system sensor histidine kinase/response regulator
MQCAVNNDEETLLTAIVEGSPYAKVLVDDNGRISLVNSQTEKLFGYAAGELLHQPIEMLVPERFRDEDSGLRALFCGAPNAAPIGARRDLYGRCKDGSEVAIEIGLNPITTDAGFFTLAAITDITERKRAEDSRRLHDGIRRHAEEVEALNRQLASASRFKTQFVATMSHELRTPLTAIIGAAELLNRTDLDARAHMHVQTIGSSAEALLAVINSILDFSKIEAGKVDLQTTSFLAETVLESAAEVLAQLARQKGITLHTYVDPAIPPLEGDSDRLRQILLNLLGNAVKFTDSGQVVARALALNSTEHDIVLRFEVQDTGIGIAPEMQTRLFEPFVQADGLATRKHGGTGLGLSISKRLVDLMGGEIGVESAPGSGALFWFTPRFGRPSDPVPVQQRWLAGVTGLILTGDDMFAQITKRYMTAWHMDSCRVASRSDLLTTLQSRGDASWVAIVDVDDVGAADVSDAVEVVRAILPTRVITIGGGGPMGKPVRQSNLYDAIVLASNTDRLRRDAEIPSARRAVATIDNLSRTHPVRNGVTVLVAEDNVQLQKLLQLQFDELGVVVKFVSNGAQTIDALGIGTYSMVFMDCHMPILDGLSATRAIRANEAATGGHVQITAMTANAFVEDRAECIAAGMDDYLAKPIRLANLRSAIERGLKANTPA